MTHPWISYVTTYFDVDVEQFCLFTGNADHSVCLTIAVAKHKGGS